MKKTTLQPTSFLIGLLAGAAILVLLAMSLPARTEALTNQQLRRTGDQFQGYITRTFAKDTLELRAEYSLLKIQFDQKVIKPVTNWFHGITGTSTSSVHPSSAPVCAILTWVNQAQINFMKLLGIHSQPWRIQACS